MSLFALCEYLNTTLFRNFKRGREKIGEVCRNGKTEFRCCLSISTREVLPDLATEGCYSRRKGDRFILMACPNFRLNAGATEKTVVPVTHKSMYQP